MRYRSKPELNNIKSPSPEKDYVTKEYTNQIYGSILINKVPRSFQLFIATEDKESMALIRGYLIEKLSTEGQSL